MASQPKVEPPPKKEPALITQRRERLRVILPLLKKTYPEARCSLDFANPLELLVATILSAQCTDARVNIVTKTLFARYRNAQDYASADPTELESIIQSTGFYRNKAKSIIAMAKDLLGKHQGQVPQTMDELHSLAGVGRKTANVVLGNAFDINVGVTVDTHVTRLANRLALTRHKIDAVKIEKDLIPIVPEKERALFSHLLIHHGRAICDARKPKCDQCVLFSSCPSGPKFIAAYEKKASTKAPPKRAKPTNKRGEST